MPRVTPEHSAARRQQILDAARVCFLRDGFHRTSMQDIQREAGLSAGAIYLYFKSKSDIILGIATQILEMFENMFPREPVVGGELLELPELLRLFVIRAEELQRERGIFSLAIQTWAEAVRDPAMRQSLHGFIAGVKARIQTVLEESQARGLIHADADPVGLTMVIIGLGQGYIVQRALFDETTLERYVAGMEGLLMNAALLEDGLRARAPGEAS